MRLAMEATGSERTYRRVDVDKQLFRALRTGDVELARDALKRGANANYTDSHDGMTLLHKEAEEGHIEIVTALLEHGAKVNSRTDFDIHAGLTPLHYAAHEGHTEVAELLLEHGADVHTPDVCYGETPLIMAVGGRGNVKTVETLLRYGADANDMDNGISENACASALHWVMIMAEHDLQQEDLEKIRLLLEYGADPSTPYAGNSKPEGTTPLHICADVKTTVADLEAAKLLLEYGADINATNERGDTPLHIAVKQIIWDTNNANDDRRHSKRLAVEMIKLFLHHGADKNIPNRIEETPVDLVEDLEDGDEVKALLLNNEE